MVTAWASVTGVIRAGFTVLLLSPRNSPLALAHLLKSTKCGMIVHSTDSFVEDVLAETLGLLRESGEASTALCQLPKYSEIYGQQDVVQPVPRYQAVHSDDIAIISHTSGLWHNTFESSHCNWPTVMSQDRHRFLNRGWSHIERFCNTQNISVCGLSWLTNIWI